ncbi:protoglobin domain-containing protein [Sorangium sp. So ce176]|uniref:protoglobin domain-containing protein n=1 Tax=Sorangium sp. So ce176 TaxID=3133286 RepID=UPI003F5D9AA2
MVGSDAVPAVETLFDEIKRYVRFSDEDAGRLAAFHAYAEPHFRRIADEFYDRIREHEGAHEIVTGEAQVERLKGSLVHWMTRICTGPYDDAYFEETAKIGRVHVRAGLPQHYMFTAMNLIRLAFEEIAWNALGGDMIPVRAAVSKVLDLELAIMLETYRDDFVARAQRAGRLDREEVGRTLARTEHRYKSAVELARVLVVGLDAHAVVRLFNREAERMTGLGREEILGMPFVETLLPEELHADHGALVKEIAAGRRADADLLESSLRTRAGKIRDVRWQLAYAPSAADDEVVLFAIGQDTTDENALAARVRQSEKLAAVGTLAAGLAHEIRNPLNGAQLHVTFLERGLARAGMRDPDTVEAIKVVRDEIRRLSVLVSEFLDFARPKPLVLTPTSVASLCERAVRLALACDGASAQAEVKVDLPSTDIVLELDPAKIEQVLLNLLHNAIEAVAPSRDGTVVLRARRQPRHAVIEVEDDGAGVPNPDAPIFDPFYSTKPNGTGLGLAIAHRIITDHEGTIEFQSRPGKTLFRVTLPIRLSG